MSLKDLTKYIVSGIIDEESFTIEEIEDDESLTINIKTDDSNVGKIIGKDGKIINSIRTIIQEASSLRDRKFVKVEVNKED